MRSGRGSLADLRALFSAPPGSGRLFPDGRRPQPDTRGETRAHSDVPPPPCPRQGKRAERAPGGPVPAGSRSASTRTGAPSPRPAAFPLEPRLAAPAAAAAAAAASLGRSRAGIGRRRGGAVGGAAPPSGAGRQGGCREGGWGEAGLLRSPRQRRRAPPPLGF